MGERKSNKIPVTEREFLWVQDDDKGEVVLHVGPTMVSPTAADRIVVDDGKGSFVESMSTRPQRMIEVADNQYAVLDNPLLEPDEGPNGRFKSGRNESRPLRNGTRKMIPGPCSFWLRPGQRCEVRDAHELGSNQYLVVKVYGAIDESAPYYDITVGSAFIKSTTDEKDTELNEGKTAQAELTRGQLIVIRGLDTQFYIPPTGVDIVPDTSVDPSGSKLDARAARQLLAQLPAAPEPRGEVSKNVLSVDLDDFAEDELDSFYEAQAEENIAPSKAKPRKKVGRRRPKPQIQQAMNRAYAAPPPPAPEPAPLDSNMIQNVMSNAEFRKAVEREARKSRLVRDAVVLGEKEFCVIIDADGKRQIKVGPARVFPGPYDQFQTVGSNDRVFMAYELLPQRALWLRFIAPLSASELRKRLPRGIKLNADQYEPGDELIVTGVNTFFFPFNEIEILSPQNGQPVFGNDHSEVFIEAIGIDQKSGIYVSDLATGEVRLVRGKCSYLVDPRKEVHVSRRVPVKDWNQWIAYGEPHKQTSSLVETWWALSVVVPPNTACMITSANSQRVVEGPMVTLLEYEERLVPLSLSTGVPKNENSPLTTCFLRVNGNRVSDSITVETKDFVEIGVRVSFSVTFQREKKRLWFATENYVQVLCEHIRSLVRNTCRTRSLIELWPILPTLIRETILGPKAEDGSRPGRTFEEYGFVVTEVEVLASEIQDKSIAQQMRQMQNQSVALQIGDRQAHESYESAKKRASLDAQQHLLKVDGEKRRAEFARIVSDLEQQIKVSDMRAEQQFETERRALTAERELESAKAEAARNKLTVEAFTEKLATETEAKVAAQKKWHLSEEEHERALSSLKIALIQAQSQATVAEREAVQAGLIEALTGLGDKVMLSEVAKNMNLVSLFKGKAVGNILQDVLGGTRVIETLRKLNDDYGDADEHTPEG